jgi:uncharacterized protein (TIGR03435 family)
MHKAVLVLLAGGVLTLAQDTRPAFEAASVKLDTAGGGHSGTDGSKGQVVITNLTLHRLIERAYNLKPPQVSGPDWLDTVRVDIAAKYPGDAKDSDRALMLRTLIEDRFKLAAHRETREMPGYALVVAKGGFKLKPVDTDDDDTQHQGGRVQSLAAKGVSMTLLADLVSRYMNAVVIDQTGLGGVYNFELRWVADDANSDRTEDIPTLPIALEETLGVRLRAQKVPLEVLVVDRMERVPIAN